MDIQFLLRMETNHLIEEGPMIHNCYHSRIYLLIVDKFKKEAQGNRK